MPNDLKALIFAQLGNPLPATVAEREAVYNRVRAEVDAMLAGETASAEHAEKALAVEQAIESIEAELQSAGQTAPAGPAVELQRDAGPGAGTTRLPRVAAAIVAAIAVLTGGIWYFVAAPHDAPTAPDVAVPQTGAGRDIPASDKARSFQEALRDGDWATASFLLQSGYRPTRVELRAALLQVKYTPQIQAAVASLAPDIHDIACTFTSFYDVRRPMIPPRLFDAEDAFAIMKQIGQEPWRSMCAADVAKWRDALAKIEAQQAQYNKPDGEKKRQAERCIRRFSESAATDRWEQANCEACPEGHSNCASYCPNAPTAADAEEARFFSFNRSDMFMAGTMSQRPDSSRAERYCNLQYLTRPTDFDLANLQRFRSLVSLFDEVSR
jgi:hypothetical protein